MAADVRPPDGEKQATRPLSHIATQRLPAASIVMPSYSRTDQPRPPSGILKITPYRQHRDQRCTSNDGNIIKIHNNHGNVIAIAILET